MSPKRLSVLEPRCTTTCVLCLITRSRLHCPLFVFHGHPSTFVGRVFDCISWITVLPGTAASRDIVIQDDFLPPEMPFLRTLRLWNCALNPISHLLQAHLVELCLDNCQRWSRIDDVLDALERLPTLQKLSLQKDCRTILPPSFEESPRRVSLPVLEELTLYDDARAVVPLYNCLSFPFNTLVAFGVQETTSIHRTQVAAILAEYTSRRLPVLSLDISGPKPEARSTFSIEISAYPHLIGSSASDQEDTPASLLYRPLKLRLGAEWLLSGNGIPVEPTLPLSAIYHLPSLRTVRSVAINGKTGLTSSRCLRQIRSVLTHLRALLRHNAAFAPPCYRSG
ncbi:hypothetical protein OF83DRAFT_456893 [Amylostereum chailletii]|nr:hypothetical protein OF83DRAFT_456893 [Amylostereum chailletii]